MAPLKKRTLDFRWLRKPRYRKFIVVGSVIFSLNVFLVCSLVNSYRDTSLDIEDPSGRGRYHSEGLLVQDDEELGNNNIFMKQQKQHISLEKKLLKDKQVPAVSSYVNSNKLNNGAINVNNNKTSLKLEELDFIPVCNIVTKEAISAIHRAKSQSCKQMLANITCLIQNGQLYPNLLDSTCPTKGMVAGKSLGCYQDDKSLRILSGYFSNLKQTNSPQNCINLCLQSGFPYAGVQYSSECFCGVEEPNERDRLPDSSCNMKCPQNAKIACGGYLTMNIYETGIIKFTPQVPKLTASDDVKPVRIVYLLTLSGRALRQVKRLLKALYHEDHYYFIHVDTRQDYLFRELLYLEKLLPNVVLMRERHATMWSGASLLQMLLAAMKQILKMNWTWDFVINLSESDYPIKKNQELVDFLTANKGMNFVKSTGREIQRFIQKQGLDKTFVECDAHMWRIGDRQLPQGVQMDGGSDWVTLSRDFVEYIVSEQPDQLLAGLSVVYRYTLLSAESFFHTVLRNSKFCDSYIDNNLHLTNWKRQLGCKCQNKHIVDWCGCSPNDFKPDDWPRIQGTSSNQLFFARKFEAIINQAIINKVDEWVYGSSESVVNLLGYWQSIYHHHDLTPHRDDTLLSLTSSLTRLVAQQLHKHPGYHINITSAESIVELSSYHYDDMFKGLLLRNNVQLLLAGQTSRMVEYETWFKIKDHFQLLDEVNGEFIKHLCASSEFDVKELTSRNVLGSLGPLQDVVIIYQVVTDKTVNVTFLVVDPAGQLAQVTDVSLDSKTSISHLKPVIGQPLLPGTWHVKVYHDGFLVASTTFLVVPFEFLSGVPVTSQQAGLLHRGSTEYRIPADKAHWTKALDNNNSKLSLALSNQKRTDEDLRDWVDSLTREFYSVVETCSLSSHIDKLEHCRSTVWSTSSVDSKSQLTKYDTSKHRLVR